MDADHRQLGLVKKISVGICGDALAVAEELLRRLDGVELVSDATAEERAGNVAEVKTAWEAELSEWTHERDDYSLDVIEEAAAEGGLLHPRQGVARTRAGAPGGRDALHRYRQHQLRGTQLPAV